MMITHKPARTTPLNLGWAVRLCPDLLRELNITIGEGQLYRQALAESLAKPEEIGEDDEPTDPGPLERQARRAQAQGIW